MACRTQNAKFGTVRPRVQIPGPDQVFIQRSLPTSLEMAILAVGHTELPKDYRPPALPDGNEVAALYRVWEDRVPMTSPATKRHEPQKPKRRSRAVKETRRARAKGDDVIAQVPQSELPPVEIRIERG